MPTQEKFLFAIVVAAFLMAALLFAFITTIILLYQKKQQGFLQQLEDVKNKFQRELLQSKLDIEQTLQQWSREIHDNVGQHVVVVKQCLKNMVVTGEAEEMRKMALDLLTKGLADLRDLSKSLSLELIKTNGLAYAIENLVSQIGKITLFDIHFEMTGDYIFQEEQTEIFLFRILQEAVTNAIKHAEAKQIEVLLDCIPGGFLRLVIKDDGKGFDWETRNSGTGGFGTGGISHMVDRAKLIEGDILIESSPGNGTAVYITVPFKPAVAVKNEKNIYSMC